MKHLVLMYLKKKSARSWIFCIPDVSVFLQLNEDLLFSTLFWCFSPIYSFIVLQYFFIFTTRCNLWWFLLLFHEIVFIDAVWDLYHVIFLDAAGSETLKRGHFGDKGMIGFWGQSLGLISVVYKFIRKQHTKRNFFSCIIYII